MIDKVAVRVPVGTAGGNYFLQADFDFCIRSTSCHQVKSSQKTLIIPHRAIQLN